MEDLPEYIKQDEQVVGVMLRKQHIAPSAAAWTFFKKHFLLPCLDSNNLAQEICMYMHTCGYTKDCSMPDGDAKQAFVAWVRNMWKPTKYYPSAVRAQPNSRDNKGRHALNFENKLWDFFDSLLGPKRKLKVSPTTLSGIEGHLGLFSATANLRIPRDIAYIWGDVHQVNCTDEQWEKYARSHTSCFEIPCEGIPKRFLFSGPVSLANHHCINSYVSIGSGGSLIAHGTNKFQLDEEIFLHYGEEYFHNTKCVCCV